jgi:small subunit ribosomal protein S3
VGQKTHPYSLRLGYIKDWKAKWFARKDFSRLLHEDLKIRKFLKEKLRMAGVADIVIERSAGKIRIWIYTARPGLIIGRGGQEINRVRDEVSNLTQSEVFLDIKEVETPQTNAQLVAENVAVQLEKRVAFRKAMKKAVATAMAKGAGGIKIQAKGRLGGTEIARSEGYKEGKVPLSTFRADVNYGFATAFTTYGTIGVKTWIYLGEVLVKQEQAKRAKEWEKTKQQMLGKQEKHEKEVQVPTPVAAIPAEVASVPESQALEIKEEKNTQ